MGINSNQKKFSSRPELSFITSKRFSSMDQFTEFCENATDDEARKIQNAIVHIPELIAIAEMYLDSHKNPESLPFLVAFETLISIEKLEY